MNVTILGGGIAGLLAAYVFRAVKPLLLEAAPELGGNYTAGGLKYIRRTPAFEDLLTGLVLPWRPHKPVGMLYFAGHYYDHPSWMRDVCRRDQRLAIQEVHWKRTRGTHEGFRGDCMNDPLGNGADVAMDCDHVTLLKLLAALARAGGAQLRTSTKVVAVHANAVEVESDGRRTELAHDLLITTLPLPLMAKLAPWANLPAPNARKLTVIDFRDNDRDHGHPTWDYMYTPLEHYVTRVTWPVPSRFQVEIPGPPYGPNNISRIDEAHGAQEVAEEVSTILAPYAAAPYALGVRAIPGHLEPLARPVEWPTNWRPLGRYAQWEPRATAEKVLDTAQDYLAKL